MAVFCGLLLDKAETASVRSPDCVFRNPGWAFRPLDRSRLAASCQVIRHRTGQACVRAKRAGGPSDCAPRATRYIGPMTKEQINAVLAGVRSWPQQDQEELVEIAREIEARRTGVYIMSDDERRAIAQARQSRLASDDEVDAFWKARGIA